MRRAVANGGVFIFQHAGEDVAVALVNPRLNSLLVLTVLPNHRSHGLGSAIIAYLQCNFARVLESAIPFFERQGYRQIGDLKAGVRFNTGIMVKSALIPLAGRLPRFLMVL